MNPHLFIKIDYLTHDSRKGEIVLSSDQYFDEKPETDSFEVNSVPKFNHAFEYLHVSRKELKNVHLVIKEASNSKEHFYTFWNGGRNYSLATINSYNSIIREELILCSTIEDNPLKTEIIRLSKKDNFYVPTSHAIIIDRNEKEETIEFPVKGNDALLHV